MKGYALLIGVDSLDTKHYVSNVSIPCAPRNLDRLYKLLIQTGKYQQEDIKLFSTQNNITPTWQNVEKSLKCFEKGSTKDTGFLVLYLTCHSLLTEVLGSNSTKKKNFLCFNDQLVYENQWKSVLQNIDSKFEVFIILDTCYASGVNKDRMGALLSTYQVAYNRNDPRYTDLDRKYRVNTISSNEANLCFLFSSKEKKSSISCSSGGEQNTFFTNKFANLWEDHFFQRDQFNYRKFYNLIKIRSSPTDDPFFDIIEKKVQPPIDESTTIFHTNYPLFF